MRNRTKLMATLGFAAVGAAGLFGLVVGLSTEGSFGRWGPVGVALLISGLGMLFLTFTGRWNLVSTTTSELWAAVCSLLLVVCAAALITAAVHLSASGTFLTPAVLGLFSLALAGATIRKHFTNAPSKEAK